MHTVTFFIVILYMGGFYIAVRPNRIFRAVPSAIIGEGGLYSYIRVLPDEFLLKAIVFTVCEHEYMNMNI
jgi:hypothetical protein